MQGHGETLYAERAFDVLVSDVPEVNYSSNIARETSS
jgi:hypothetical protein